MACRPASIRKTTRRLDRTTGQSRDCVENIMKALLVYGSTWGNTRKVVQRLPAWLSFPVDIVNVGNLTDDSLFRDYDLLLFFASTSGDQELQPDMESFLVKHRPDLAGKPYAVCELGNYFGYDDFEFGAERILSFLLNQSGGCELVPPFAMDTFPHRDWNGLARWCNLLNDTVCNGHARS